MFKNLSDNGFHRKSKIAVSVQVKKGLKPEEEAKRIIKLLPKQLHDETGVAYRGQEIKIKSTKKIKKHTKYIDIYEAIAIL